MKSTISNQAQNMIMLNNDVIKKIELGFKEIIGIENTLTSQDLIKTISNNDLLINDSISNTILSIININKYINNFYTENSPIINNENNHKSISTIYDNVLLNLNHTLKLIENMRKDILHIHNIKNLISPDTQRIREYYPSKVNLQVNLKNTLDGFLSLNDHFKELELYEIEYIKRFKNETILIEQKFENKIDELTNEYENKFKNFELRYEKISKSNELLNTGVDAGLKSLNQLNERTQNIEFEFSKIIGAESEKVKNDLNGSRTALNNVIQEITTSANTKLNEINKAHTDFINLVSNAGIYKLTDNYDKKAKEEQNEYKTYRKRTTQAIIAAIVSTLVIFIFAFLEHLFSTTKSDTNFLLLASRLSISLMFFVLAFYLSKQAAKHYECYQENHRTFLQLAALEPFMARMTPDEQKEIRKGLIPSYFNQSADGKFAAKGDEVDIPTNIYAIVNRAFDLVGEKKEPKTAENTATETKASV